MAKFRVYGGTEKQGENLCLACDHAQVVEGARDKMIFCRQLAVYAADHATIRFPVLRCTDFQNKNTPSRHDFEEIAWKLEIKGGRVIGFKAPKKEDE